MRFPYSSLGKVWQNRTRRAFKVWNVNFDNNSSTQLAVPAEMGGLGMSSASLLALPAFLASAFGASDFLTTIFSETFEDVSFTKALEKWSSLTNEQESPLDGTQKNWTQPVYAKPPKIWFLGRMTNVRKFLKLIGWAEVGRRNGIENQSGWL